MSKTLNKCISKTIIKLLKHPASILALAFIVTIIICSIIFGGFLSDAHDNNDLLYNEHVYFKSIEIEYGDTLWSIAKTYLNEEYETTEGYINELKQMNNLYTDDIQAENYLTIKYYERK